MLKKKYNKLENGLCYIRKGSTQNRALRADFDSFYLNKEEIGVKIVDQVIEVEEDGRFDILFRNRSNNPITIMGGYLEVFNEVNEKLTEHRLWGVDKVDRGVDFKMLLSPKYEKPCEVILGFTSNDCIRLGLDEDGLSNKLYKVRFTVWDSDNNEYDDFVENILISARGKILWKVQAASKKVKRKGFKLRNIF